MHWLYHYCIINFSHIPNFSYLQKYQKDSSSDEIIRKIWIVLDMLCEFFFLFTLIRYKFIVNEKYFYSVHTMSMSFFTLKIKMESARNRVLIFHLLSIEIFPKLCLIGLMYSTPVANSSYMVSFTKLLDYYDYTVRMK